MSESDENKAISIDKNKVTIRLRKFKEKLKKPSTFKKQKIEHLSPIDMASQRRKSVSGPSSHSSAHSNRSNGGQDQLAAIFNQLTILTKGFNDLARDQQAIKKKLAPNSMDVSNDEKLLPKYTINDSIYEKGFIYYESALSKINPFLLDLNKLGVSGVHNVLGSEYIKQKFLLSEANHKTIVSVVNANASGLKLKAEDFELIFSIILSRLLYFNDNEDCIESARQIITFRAETLARAKILENKWSLVKKWILNPTLSLQEIQMDYITQVNFKKALNSSGKKKTPFKQKKKPYSRKKQQQQSQKATKAATRGKK
jgi:hypothetical protein